MIAGILDVWSHELVVDHVFPRTVLLGPLKWQVANLSGFGEFGALIQRSGQHALVPVGVVRLAKRASHGEVHEDGPRRVGLLHDVPDCAHEQRRNAGSLDAVCDKTHGLVAEGSVGDEQTQVNVELPQLVGKGRGQFLLDLLMELSPAGERKEQRGDTANLA